MVFARGRLFHENILEKINDGQFYTKYLTGQIEADFLDTDKEADIATSDRQRIQEDDKRYTDLLLDLRSILTAVEKQWSEWRGKHAVEEAKKISPGLVDWLKSLNVSHRKSAETLIAKLGSLKINNETDRKILYRHGILAFERIKLRNSIEEFVSSVGDVGKLLPILAGLDEFEASLYRDIITTRLDVIREFQNNIDENVMEKVLQKYLFKHLWLLDPAWERATGSVRMESRLTQKGEIFATLTKEEKLGRVDIAYRTSAGKHIIVELKRAGEKMKLLELQGQGQRYVDGLKKILLERGEKSPNIEVVFVLGKLIDEETTNPNPDRIKKSMSAISEGSRIVYYAHLLANAQKAYSEYFDKGEELDRIGKILKQI